MSKSKIDEYSHETVSFLERLEEGHAATALVSRLTESDDEGRDALRERLFGRAPSAAAKRLAEPERPPMRGAVVEAGGRTRLTLRESAAGDGERLRQKFARIRQEYAKLSPAERAARAAAARRGLAALEL